MTDFPDLSVLDFLAFFPDLGPKAVGMKDDEVLPLGALLVGDVLLVLGSSFNVVVGEVLLGAILVGE